MAYPTGMLSFVLEEVDSRIIAIKKQCQSLRNDSAAGPIQSGRIISLFQYLRVERAALQQASTVPGLGAYAQEQKNQPGLNIGTEFTALLAAIDNVTTWISANFPVDPGTSSLLERTLGPDGPIERTFTTAQMAGLRAQLDTIIAAIA